MSAIHKQLKVKVGVIKRTVKEHASYDKEIQSQTDKIEKMKADGKDFHDIKQQDEVLKEAQTCLGDSKRRLDNAVQDLEEFLKVESDNVQDAPDLEEANALVTQYSTKEED